MLLSLYAGCGGLDLGFERAGFDVGLAYDIRESAVASWNRNRPGAENGRVGDLSLIRMKDIDGHHGGKFRPSGVIGGPPCQSFSRANHKRSDSDPRSLQVRRFFSIALRFHRYRRPLDFILLENVPELAQAREGKLLEREALRLKRNGFDVRRFVLDAVDYSVPQYRKRLFVLGLPDGSSAAEHWRVPSSMELARTVRQAIGGLPRPMHFRRELSTQDIPVHPNHWCMNPKSLRFFDGSLLAGSTSGRSFKTLAWDAPSVAASYGHREVHVHPEGRRRLSVFEAMRIQGFPDNFVLEGSLSAQIDQVSEAVPPPLAEAVAISVASAIGTQSRSMKNTNEARVAVRAAVGR